MTCEICGRVSLQKGPLCRYHDQALTNLRAMFDTWREALGIDWERYLETISNLDETGMWVKEVIEYLMSQDDLEALM